MTTINPYNSDPEEARHAFADFLMELEHTFNSELYDLEWEIDELLPSIPYPHDLREILPELAEIFDSLNKTPHAPYRLQSETTNFIYFEAVFLTIDHIKYFKRNQKNIDATNYWRYISLIRGYLMVIQSHQPTIIEGSYAQKKAPISSSTLRYKTARDFTLSNWGNFVAKNNIATTPDDKIIREFEKSNFQAFNMKLKNKELPESAKYPEQKKTVIDWIKNDIFRQELQKTPNPFTQYKTRTR